MKLFAQVLIGLFLAVIMTYAGSAPASAQYSKCTQGSNVEKDNCLACEALYLNDNTFFKKLLTQPGYYVRPNAPGACRGHNFLHAAALNNNLDAATLLVKAGADVNLGSPLPDIVNINQWNQLQNRVGWWQLFLDNGLDLNLQTHEGKTFKLAIPTWWVTLRTCSLPGAVNAAKLIIDRGADPFKAGSGNVSLISYAANIGNNNFTTDQCREDILNYLRLSHPFDKATLTSRHLYLDDVGASPIDYAITVTMAGAGSYQGKCVYFGDIKESHFAFARYLVGLDPEVQNEFNDKITHWPKLKSLNCALARLYAH